VKYSNKACHTFDSIQHTKTAARKQRQQQNAEKIPHAHADLNDKSVS